MKAPRLTPSQLKEKREEQKKKEMERCWELWERHRDKLFHLEAYNIYRGGKK